MDKLFSSDPINWQKLSQNNHPTRNFCRLNSSLSGIQKKIKFHWIKSNFWNLNFSCFLENPQFLAFFFLQFEESLIQKFRIDKKRET